MPQTRFVLRRALALGHRVIVVLNKLDRTDARPAAVLDEVFDLFVELGADDRQLDFPVLYASAREGYARRDPADPATDIHALLDVILEEVPPPAADPGAPFRMQVTTFEDDDFIGRIVIGRIFSGRVARGQRVAIGRPGGETTTGRVDGLFTFRALGRVAVEEAVAGDICALSGIEETEIGDTICEAGDCAALPAILVEEPTIRMLFAVNDSPFSGRDGTYVTSRQVRDRLYREAKRNVALRVHDADGGEGWVVSGRGVLHLGILVENMRREGYEFQVGKPNVIPRIIDGETCEPIEEAIVEVPSSLSGRVIELLGGRRGEMSKMEQRGSTDHLVFHIPSRGLVGVRTRLLTLTGGEAIFHHSFHQYEPFKGPIPRRQGGTLVSAQTGEATTYALFNLQDRGTLFITPGTPVYEGMIVGEFNKEGDPAVNVCRGRKLTNMRAASADRTLRLAPARTFSVEEALEYIEEDEFLEVTPRNLRLRKRILSELGRRQARRRESA